MLEGKTVLLGVTGSIAAYKIAYLASTLKKQQADVHVLMTRNATNFINPITFETLTAYYNAKRRMNAMYFLYVRLFIHNLPLYASFLCFFICYNSLRLLTAIPEHV